MKVYSIRGRVAAGAMILAAAGLAVGGVALASTPSTPSAAGGPHVYVGYHKGAVVVPYSPHTGTLGHLSLPAGVYTVSAKAWMQSQAGTGNSSVSCTLTLGGSSDQGQADAQDGNAPTGPEPVRNEMLSLDVSGSISHGSTVKLRCENFGAGFTVLEFIEITAIKVGGLTKTRF